MNNQTENETNDSLIVLMFVHSHNENMTKDNSGETEAEY